MYVVGFGAGLLVGVLKVVLLPCNPNLSGLSFTTAVSTAVDPFSVNLLAYQTMERP